MIRKEFYKFKEIYLLFALLICAFLIYFGVKLRAILGQMGGVETNLIFLFQKGFSFYHITDLNLVFAVSINGNTWGDIGTTIMSYCLSGLWLCSRFQNIMIFRRVDVADQGQPDPDQYQSVTTAHR